MKTHQQTDQQPIKTHQHPITTHEKNTKAHQKRAKPINIKAHRQPIDKTTKAHQKRAKPINIKTHRQPIDKTTKAHQKRAKPINIKTHRQPIDKSHGLNPRICLHFSISSLFASDMAIHNEFFRCAIGDRAADDVGKLWWLKGLVLKALKRNMR